MIKTQLLLLPLYAINVLNAPKTQLKLNTQPQIKTVLEENNLPTQNKNILTMYTGYEFVEETKQDQTQFQPINEWTTCQPYTTQNNIVFTATIQRFAQRTRQYNTINEDYYVTNKYELYKIDLSTYTNSEIMSLTLNINAWEYLSDNYEYEYVLYKTSETFNQLELNLDQQNGLLTYFNNLNKTIINQNNNIPSNTSEQTFTIINNIGTQQNETIYLFLKQYNLNPLSNENHLDLDKITINYNIPNTIVVNYEVMDLAGLLWQILAMPLAFISTGFNLTLFQGTPYQINISNILLLIIGILVMFAILKIILKIFL